MKEFEGHVFGDEILSRYEVEEVIGRGAAGIVLMALQKSLNRHVALKFLPDIGHQSRAFRKRFYQEALLLSKLSHPCIVSIIDYGVDGNIPYLVEELVKGSTLDIFMDDNESIPPRLVVKLGCQIARALAHAHENNVIHRDIKPDNIFITKENKIKLFDFGLAKNLAKQTALTETGAVIGTPIYMAPEQMLGRACTRASDIYSLGMILYELLADRRPFKSSTADYAKCLAAKQNEKPPRLDKLKGRNIPGPLALLVEEALAADPQDRPASAQDFERRLREVFRPGIPRRAGTTSSATTDAERDVHASAAMTTDPGSDTSGRTRCPFPAKRISRRRNIPAFIASSLLLSLILFFTAQRMLTYRQDVPQGTIPEELRIVDIRVAPGPVTATIHVTASRPCYAEIKVKKALDKKTIFEKNYHKLNKKWSIPIKALTSSCSYTFEIVLKRGPTVIHSESCNFRTLDVKKRILVNRIEDFFTRSPEPRIVKPYAPPVFDTRREHLVIASFRVGLACIDVSTRKNVWSTGNLNITATNHDSERIYNTVSAKILECRSIDTGVLLWSLKYENEIRDSFYVTPCGVVISVVDDGLYCLDAKSGRQKWKIFNPLFCEYWFITRNNEILLQDAFRRILIYNATDGHQQTFSRHFRAGQLAMNPIQIGDRVVLSMALNGISIAPIYGGSCLKIHYKGKLRCFTHGLGYLFCSLNYPPALAAYELKNGKKIWSRPVARPIRKSLAIFKEVLYCIDGTGTVSAYDGFTGNLLWTEKISASQDFGLHWWKHGLLLATNNSRLIHIQDR